MVSSQGIEFEVPEWLVHLWWRIAGLSPCCGAEIMVWSWKKAYCAECGDDV